MIIKSKIKKIARKILYFLEIISKKTKWGIIEYRMKKKWIPQEEIKEYRKKIKIYDAFNFFNELELLEIRLNILDDYVDYFVIVESTLTHSGQKKELYYEKNINLFKKFEHKIIHHVIADPLKNFDDAKERLQNPKTPAIEKTILKEALSSDNIRPGEDDFLRDFYEKECVKIPLMGLSDDDFCFVSDLDEIWNPDLIIDYSKDDIFKPLLDNYVYFLNNRSNEIEGGTGTIGTKYKNIKDKCLNHLRTPRKTNYLRLSNGGWHFTFQGKSDMVRKKLEAYSYQGEANIKARAGIEKRISNNEDIFGRCYNFWKDERKLPKYILNNRQKYQHLLKRA
jgi:beta-1,4-mannosyl-glycoprotein beta-1,4-N-acetylglucosaminyltransferase